MRLISTIHICCSSLIHSHIKWEKKDEIFLPPERGNLENEVDLLPKNIIFCISFMSSEQLLKRNQIGVQTDWQEEVYKLYATNKYFFFLTDVLRSGFSVYRKTLSPYGFCIKERYYKLQSKVYCLYTLQKIQFVRKKPSSMQFLSFPFPDESNPTFVHKN